MGLKAAACSASPAPPGRGSFGSWVPQQGAPTGAVTHRRGRSRAAGTPAANYLFRSASFPAALFKFSQTQLIFCSCFAAWDELTPRGERRWRQIPGELALPRSCRGTEGHDVPVLRSHQVPKPGWGLLGDTNSRDPCPGSCSPCGTVPGGCVGARATGHVARPCLPASSLAILKPYSSPVPLIRNANDVMKLDSSIACSS